MSIEYDITGAQREVSKCDFDTSPKTPKKFANSKVILNNFANAMTNLFSYSHL